MDIGRRLALRLSAATAAAAAAAAGVVALIFLAVAATSLDYDCAARPGISCEGLSAGRAGLVACGFLALATACAMACWWCWARLRRRP